MPHILFITGKLAEPALRRTLADLAARAGFEYSVGVLPITVAALATTPWIARHLEVPAGVDRILLPGLCLGELNDVADRVHVAVERGPEDLRDLPAHFGADGGRPSSYGAYDIAILAEINHVQRLARQEILRQARQLLASGADVIDLGCDPGTTWKEARETVQALREEGARVSIDSFNPHEVEAAVAGGAELVLSVNSTNRDAAKHWGCEVVAIPDTPANLEGLEQTIEVLDAAKVSHRIDQLMTSVVSTLRMPNSWQKPSSNTLMPAESTSVSSVRLPRPIIISARG